MHGKEISVDITVNSNSPNWSLCYDRKGMAAYVDYEVIMGYDQTPGGESIFRASIVLLMAQTSYCYAFKTGA